MPGGSAAPRTRQVCGETRGINTDRGEQRLRKRGADNACQRSDTVRSSHWPRSRVPCVDQRRLYYSTFRSLLHILFCQRAGTRSSTVHRVQPVRFPAQSGVRLAPYRLHMAAWQGTSLARLLGDPSTHCATRHDRSQMDSAPVSAQRAILKSS